MIGQIVNFRYEVLEKIGDGAFFSVYKSRDKVLNRLVALKVISKNLVDDAEFAEAVAEGYRDVAPLAHPGIARVLDAECRPGECYIACEYARGTSVRERVHRAGPVAAPLALEIIIPVMEALEYAHANRIVHGDIRPHDIVVGPDGEVKLTDFGLSTALNRHPEVADHFAMRSARYQAPEISEGSAPTPVSDIYSVGVVLYEMLTGSPPFDGPTAVAIAMNKIKETPPAPRSINTAIPKSLNDIVMRAIERSPENRYPNASAMLADLRALRDALRLGKPASIGQYTAQAKQVEREPEPASAEASEEPLKSRYWTLMVLFVVVVLVTLGGTMLFMGRQGGIRVPPLLGKTWDEALYEAQEKGIKLEDDGRVYSESYEAGKICSVIPPAGNVVPRGNPIVKVKISKGPSVVEVPDLTGLYEADANQAAVDAGFAIGKVKEEYSDKVPVNSVISQEPEGGLMRPPGSALDLVISLGPKPEPVDETEPTTEGLGPRRGFNVAIDVPAQSDGPQEVMVMITDDRGETIAYDRVHDPGDKFSTNVTTYGRTARIRVQVGDQIVSDKTY